LPTVPQLYTGVDQARTGVNALLGHELSLSNIPAIYNDPKVQEIGTGAGPVAQLLPQKADPLDTSGVKPEPKPDAKPADRHPTKPYNPSFRIDLYFKPYLTDPAGVHTQGYQASAVFTGYF
jgi:hypothetical protein